MDQPDRFRGMLGRPRDGLYEPALADTEREAVADLLQYLENVGSICRCLDKPYVDTLTYREERPTSSPASRYRH